QLSRGVAGWLGRSGSSPLGEVLMSARVLIAVGFGMALIASFVDGSLRAQGGDRHPVSAEQYQRWKTELSNWGRWGKEDQIGALNLITPAKRRQAARPDSEDDF